MKPAILLFILLFSVSNDFGEVDQLIEKKQYSAAFKLLDTMDPENQDPEVFRRKVDLLVNNYVQTISFRMFALKNMEEGEDVENVRGTNGQFDLFNLDIHEVSKELLEKYPEDYQLKFSVGMYYYKMHLNCQSCVISKEETVELYESLLTEAYENEVYNWYSVYGLGYAKLLKQGYEESIPYFKKSIELNSEYPSSHYNLAYAYLSTQDLENGHKYALKALELYEFPEYKADAARILGNIYVTWEQPEKAYEYYQLSDEINPDNYYSLKFLMELERELYKDNSTYVDRFFALDPDNPTIYQDLMEVYYANDEFDVLMAYFNEKEKSFADDILVLANLDFYRALLLYDQGEFQKSIDSFEEARTKFKTVFEEDHEVFKAIDSYVEDIKNKM